ncbi:class I SAM-dependent methyltransferase [Promethearchaeum syntrophicum]|uniref:Class I SAM-dependent methyltransferase n=1 Tax=Promethearchaeum syntrophicum TaxID=2594042 RepID=A0A5B9DFL1_9ARCH|nr:class I SAM-dependent methyltransferase [Candidatus Prometheoarchaeum syntrophicum]QEE18099.1 trans-aconitate 2-methyltransferase [Candidatus Prometheoarchaeum syntrophicum]
MTILYSKLARAYHEMYQTIFDYDQDFQIYDTFLKKYNGKKVLELGCGSGNLGHRLVQANYNYLGLDLFPEMLTIARDEFPDIIVQQGDMRSFELKTKFDVILISGRSFCYLTTNQDVIRCLIQVFKHLKPNGILIFDNFYAPIIFSDFHTNLEQEAIYQTRKYRRISKNNPNFQTGWTWNWDAKYIVEENNQIQEYFDYSILRAFTEDELQLFLNLCGFNILELKKENAAIWLVAQKKNSIREIIKKMEL